jgi:4-amino-4-deoxy-L-arabinose transferase-like glycosyltransferase
MNKLLKVTVILIAACIIALPMCFQASTNKLFIYDESYYFIQAYELGEHGNFFIDFDPSVKLRNTKPYLFSAIQTILGKTIGWNEWALRLPVIFSAVGLVLLLYTFIRNTFKDTLWALCASTLLLVQPYYVYPHMAFTGDHDVPLIFFTTAFLFAFYLFLITSDFREESKNIRYLYVTATVSILTKGWMILFFLPFCLIFLFLYKKQKALFINRNFWIGLIASITVLAAWYLGREYVNPGYLDAVWEYEIGRYSNEMQSIHPEWSYYWLVLCFEQVQYWVLVLPVVLYMLWIDKAVQHKTVLYYLLIVSVGFVFILSFSKVKLLWYDAPALPLFAVILGSGIAYGIRYVTAHIFGSNNRWVTFSLYALIFICFYIQIFNRNFSRSLSEEYGEFIMHKQRGEEYAIVHKKYNPHLFFYNQYAKQNFGIEHTIKKIHSDFQIKEKLLVCEPLVLLNITKKYEYTTIDSTQACKLIEIKKSR